MTNSDQLRAEMVETQLLPRGIKNPEVLTAFRHIPRHLFVPEDIRASAYGDYALPIGNNQTISQPYMVAIMTELLDIKKGEKVLEIGTGSGYQTAILAELGAKVYTIERYANLSRKAEMLLQEFGYSNIIVIVGDGTEGYAPAAPFDKIIVTAACQTPPPPLIEQLAEGGKMIIPLGERFLQTLTILTKVNGQIKTENSIGCVFVPLLPGSFAL